MRLVAVASAILLVVSLGTTRATAAGRDFPGGALPLRFNSVAPLAVEPTDVIVVRGTVTAPAGAIVVLRIDDGQSGGYASRVNLERAVPAGPFAWTVPVAGLKTSGGRVLSTNDIRRIVLFAADGKAAEASVFRIEPAQPMPAGVIALSLGRADAPLFPGFTRLAPDDPRIEAGRPIAIARPGLDPLITSGMRGVERIRLPWPHDRAQVSLWTEDVGEWETLPYALERRLRVNGVDVLTQRLSPAQWIAQRYLAGHDREAPVGADAWEVYGRHRGGLITADVASPDGSVVIELAGDTPAATFLAAVMVEPAGQQRTGGPRRGGARPMVSFRVAGCIAHRQCRSPINLSHGDEGRRKCQCAAPDRRGDTGQRNTNRIFDPGRSGRPAPGRRRHGAGNGRRPARSRPARRLLAARTPHNRG